MPLSPKYDCVNGKRKSGSKRKGNSRRPAQQGRSLRNSPVLVTMGAEEIRQPQSIPRFQYTETTIQILARRSPEFRKILYSGKYIFYDGYICLKSPQCFSFINGKTYFHKEFVEQHLDEYCVAYNLPLSIRSGRFYRYSRLVAYKPSRTNRTSFSGTVRPALKEDEVDEGSSLTKAEKDIFISFIGGNGPNSFSAFFNSLLNEKNITQAELSYRTGISTKTIQHMTRSNLDTEKKIPRKYKLSYIVACALALHLDPCQSELLLSLSGHVLRCDNQLERAYRFLLNTFWHKSVYECNCILEEQGLPPMTDNKEISSYK